MAKTKTSPLQRGMSMVLAVLMLMSMFVFNAGAADQSVDLADGDVVVTVAADGTATISQGTQASKSIDAGETITFNGTAAASNDIDDIAVKFDTDVTENVALNIVIDGAIQTDGMSIQEGVTVNMTVKNSNSNILVTGDVAELTVEDGDVGVIGDVAKLTVSGGKAVVDGDVTTATVTGGTLEVDTGAIGTLKDTTGGTIVADIKAVDNVTGSDFTGSTYVTVPVEGTDFVVDYEKEETVTFKTPGKYILDGKKETIITEDTATEKANNVIKITTALDDEGYSIQFDSGVTGLESAAVTLKRAAAPAVTTTDATAADAEDGAIVITAVTGETYEYRLATDTEWTAVIIDENDTNKNATSATDDNKVTTYTVSGLPVGDYLVRVAAVKGTSFASAAYEAKISSPATEIAKPEIALETQEVTVIELNGKITLSVKNASDYSADAVYTWYLGTTKVATGATLDATTAGSYTVVVTDGALTSEASEAVELTTATLLTPPVVTTPANTDLSKVEGNTKEIELTVETVYTAEVTYQWHQDGVAITTDGTSKTLTVDEEGDYYVVVTEKSTGNSAKSNEVSISNGVERPVIEANYDDLESAGTNDFILSLTNQKVYDELDAETDKAVTYAWSKDGAALTPAETGKTLTVAATDAGKYTVAVTVTPASGTAITTTSAAFTVYADKIAAVELEATDTHLGVVGSATISNKNQTTFDDYATAGKTVTYSWSKDGVVLYDETASTLTVTEAGTYTLTVTVDGRKVVSESITITKDGVLTVSVNATNIKSSNTTLTATVDGLSKDVTLTDKEVVWTQAKDVDTITSTDDPLVVKVTAYDTYTVTVEYNGQTASASVKTSGGTNSSPSGSSSGSTTQYTLTFETNGGSTIAAKSFDKDTVVKLSEYTTTKTGYSFAGWYSDKDLTTAVSSVTMTKNTTVYAKWEKATSLLDTENHNAYIEGYSDGTFKPSNNVTRAQTATMLYRLLTSSAKSANSTTSNSFSDVSTANWYNTEVSTMSKLGVINGYTNGTFGGDKSITRAEFAVMVARLSSNTYTGDDKFDDISGHWAAKEINLAAANGWITGYSDGSYAPNKNITRAEAVTILNRVVGRDSIGEMADAANMTTFSDVSSSAWYYEAVQEAANTHTYEVKDGKEVWTTSKTATADAE